MCASRLRDLNSEELAAYAETIKDCKSKLNVDWLEEHLERLKYKRRVLETQEENAMLWRRKAILEGELREVDRRLGIGRSVEENLRSTVGEEVNPE